MFICPKTQPAGVTFIPAHGTHLTLAVSVATIPLFVRAGAVLPLAGNLSRASADVDITRILHIYPQPEGAPFVTFLMCEDDGETNEAHLGRHHQTRITTSWADGKFRLDWTSQGGWKPAFDRVTVETSINVRSTVMVNGKTVKSGETVPL